MLPPVFNRQDPEWCNSLLRYIECILLLNIKTDLLLSEETYILGIYHSIGKLSNIKTLNMCN